MKSVCVFCGSKPGTSPVFSSAAKELGQLLADKQITLVYGGASVGLMGTLADAVLEGGGKVIGVMPSHLESEERIHNKLSELIHVSDMASRKQAMLELSEGFIALPGGTGTMDEIFEMITLSQLGIHKKPCGFINTSGFYQDLFRFLEHMKTQGFLHPDYFQMLCMDDEPEVLLHQMLSFVHPHDHA